MVKRKHVSSTGNAILRPYAVIFQAYTKLSITCIQRQLTQRRLNNEPSQGELIRDLFLHTWSVPGAIKLGDNLGYGQLRSTKAWSLHRWTTTFRLRTMGKGPCENFKRARTGSSCLGCFYPRCSQVHWWYQLNLARVNDVTSKQVHSVSKRSSKCATWSKTSSTHAFNET